MRKLLVLLLLASSAPAQADEVKCKDRWNVSAQWNEMSAACERGVQAGDPLSQVATAIHLLETQDPADRREAHRLLKLAADAGYDDAYYWLGASASSPKAALAYFEQARGTGPMGLQAMAWAAEAYYKGQGAPRDLVRARAAFRKAALQAAANANNGIPAPPGEWWSNAKWFESASVIQGLGRRYGVRIKRIDGKLRVEEGAPDWKLSDEELMRLPNE
jgi:hypothetical protein